MRELKPWEVAKATSTLEIIAIRNEKILIPARHHENSVEDFP